MRFLSTSQSAGKLADVRPAIEDFRAVKGYLNKLHANRFAYQSEISKLSSFYRSLSLAHLSDSAPLLNAAIYYASIFSKKVPSAVLIASQNRIQDVDRAVLRVLAQKLFNCNQWPTAERLINRKFQPAEAELMKFEIFSLNGNRKGMLELLPYLSKTSAVPYNVQLQLQFILNSKDGTEYFERENDNRHGVLLQCALKGRVLGMNPPSLIVFLRLVSRISLAHSVPPETSLLFLGFSRCEGSSEIDDSELGSLLEELYSKMEPRGLVTLAQKMKSLDSNSMHQVVAVKLLEAICRLPTSIQGDSVSTLLCWCIRFFPEQYSYRILLTDYSRILDASIAKVALDVYGPNDAVAMEFIEFCLTEKGVPIHSLILRKAVDTAQDSFKYRPSEEFLRCIHRLGLTLSSKFYMATLRESISAMNQTRAFEAFKLISSSDLHGELLTEYISLSKELLEVCLAKGLLDCCRVIYKSLCKFELIETLTRPKSFFDYISDKHAQGHVSGPFRSTLNLECISAALHCAQSVQKSPCLRLSDRFCKKALEASLIQCDFQTALRLRVYMNNQGFCDEGPNLSRNVLRQWAYKLNNKST